jgi:predicted ArsR family transcriptional regulator
MKTTKRDHIRPIDQAVLDLLRQQRGMSVVDFTDRLEVTATAVRQRLDRLEEVGLIERRKHTIGRGRPQYQYFLTALGHRYSSVSYADLASALWAEVIELPNPALRARVLRRVAKRMGAGLIASVTDSTDFNKRLAAVASELARRKIPTEVQRGEEQLPVLRVLACPFPDLVDRGDRMVCELEQEMLSEALGQSVQLSCCRLDGHEHCNFHAVPDHTQAPG